jgi:MFS family permease
MFMSILDLSIVNVAIPTIQNEFGAATSDAQWVVTGYSLAEGVVVPVSAWLGDGTHRILGLITFSVLSLALFVVIEIGVDDPLIDPRVQILGVHPLTVVDLIVVCGAVCGGVLRATVPAARPGTGGARYRTHPVAASAGNGSIDAHFRADL